MGGEIVVYEFIVALCMGLGALCFFIWSVLGGQMEGAEDVKYRMLERERNHD